ncbi:substrate-binding domain-containing protein [Rhizobium sp. WL3]|uniref:substrate-binding domain-containing protein n=1 Tax=Rhizobium sp. WL3 TaxID=2603277 RepID=UPI001FEDC845|nr:substrate-binding domain-containing protein [Rhizobium sp. WL3]
MIGSRGFIAAAWQRGLKVGHGTAFDLRVAGHDDHPLSRYACPPITTVARNYNEIGQLAIGLLLKMLGEADDEDDVRLRRDQILLKSDDATRFGLIVRQPRPSGVNVAEQVADDGMAYGLIKDTAVRMVDARH